MTDIQKPLPHNIELEQELLGCILMNNDCFDLVARSLQPEHFYERVHQIVFEAMGKMITIGRKVNPTTLKSYMPEDVKIADDLNLGQYLARLAVNAVSPVMARDYAIGIRDLWASRKLMVTCEDIQQALATREPDVDPFAVMAPIEDEIAKLRGQRIATGEASQHGQSYLDSITKAQQRGGVSGVPICLQEISEVISSPVFEAGNLYGLLASSGEGKSSLTLQVIAHALRKGHPVLFLSFDQNADQCIRQMVAQEFSIEARRQLFGDVSEKEMKKAVDFATWIDRQPFKVIKCTDQSAPQLVGLARSFIRTNGNGKVPLVVVDHIRAIKAEDRRSDEGTKALQIGNILKGGAEQTRAAWLILNQRNTSGMRRDNPRPIIADLFGGEGALAPFDAIFYLYRFLKFYQQAKSTASTGSDWKKIDRVFPSAVREENEDIAEIGVIKSRFGNPHITSRLIFEATFTRYRSDRQDIGEMQEAML
ncbi:MAG: helicase DnaB [Nitratireductor sp.]|uniref:replicative DNA helicase n=1 Tax=Nitratireductor sp. TaxID=1872084 RepID=UPI002637B56C|nr:DnaB-like helicase N-terminal domain-containing protein [Nitratireductor sp.]MCV0348479.1 helicase DnaB [Nitratireductor sp.]